MKIKSGTYQQNPTPYKVIDKTSIEIKFHKVCKYLKFEVF